MIALSGAILLNRAWATVNAGNRTAFLRVICFAKALYVSVRAFFRGLIDRGLLLSFAAAGNR
jgi:hypothetical protein